MVDDDRVAVDRERARRRRRRPLLAAGTRRLLGGGEVVAEVHLACRSRAPGSVGARLGEVREDLGVPRLHEGALPERLVGGAWRRPAASPLRPASLVAVDRSGSRPRSGSDGRALRQELGRPSPGGRRPSSRSCRGGNLRGLSSAGMPRGGGVAGLVAAPAPSARVPVDRSRGAARSARRAHPGPRGRTRTSGRRAARRDVRRRGPRRRPGTRPARAAGRHVGRGGDQLELGRREVHRRPESWRSRGARGASGRQKSSPRPHLQRRRAFLQPGAGALNVSGSSHARRRAGRRARPTIADGAALHEAKLGAGTLPRAASSVDVNGVRSPRKRGGVPVTWTPGTDWRQPRYEHAADHGDEEERAATTTPRAFTADRRGTKRRSSCVTPRPRAALSALLDTRSAAR